MATVTDLQHLKLSTVTKVESDCVSELDRHARYWWESSGFALAVLLDRAGYSNYGQYQLLKFFREITPILGPAYIPGRPHWKSFMTDDHNPIELSWDWRTGDQPPKIRFSIEPIGMLAGTPTDPYNKSAASTLQKFIAKLQPKPNVEWLDHFQQQLNGDDLDGLVEDHPTRAFYAFDLGETGILCKAYFFPGLKARAMGTGNFNVILQTILAAKDSTPQGLEALGTFQEYVQDPLSPRLEMDMLAIDLVEPSESRFKIYFRSRYTSYASVKEVMTLGGRLRTPAMENGLQRLAKLYHALLGKGMGTPGSDDEELPEVEHRTAGILYNIEFRYGSKRPKVKAYLPVRHYAESEDAVISALKAHLGDRGVANAHVPNYVDAIKTIFSKEALSTRSGVHTYIGCSIEPNGEVRLVSYINPRWICRRQSASEYR